MSAENRRASLVQAAIAVMTRDGVAKATTRAIAAEAEMPLGVFHYAFRSKQELLVEVTETIARRSKADIDAAIFAGESDLVGTVRAGMMAYFDHLVASPKEHLVTYELTQFAIREEGMGDVAKRQYEYYLQENEALLIAVAELYGFAYTSPVSVVNRLVFALVDGLALSYLACGNEQEARDVISLAAATLTTMIRPL